MKLVSPTAVKYTYSGVQLSILQGLCDSGLVVAGQDFRDAGVSSSDRTQFTFRVNIPAKREKSKTCRINMV